MGLSGPSDAVEVENGTKFGSFASSKFKTDNASVSSIESQSVLGPLVV